MGAVVSAGEPDVGEPGHVPLWAFGTCEATRKIFSGNGLGIISRRTYRPIPRGTLSSGTNGA